MSCHVSKLRKCSTVKIEYPTRSYSSKPLPQLCTYNIPARIAYEPFIRIHSPLSELLICKSARSLQIHSPASSTIKVICIPETTDIKGSYFLDQFKTNNSTNSHTSHQHNQMARKSKHTVKTPLASRPKPSPQVCKPAEAA